MPEMGKLLPDLLRGSWVGAVLTRTVVWSALRVTEGWLCLSKRM